jgi:hypothetical protein
VKRNRAGSKPELISVLIARFSNCFYLPFAVQLTIVINDIALALLEVIQLGVARAAVSGLAMRLQVVAFNAYPIA